MLDNTLCIKDYGEMITDVRFATHTREQLSRVARDAIAIVPLGATEQHGRRLPVHTDTLIVSHLTEHATRLASPRASLVLCPAVPFGFSEHHLRFGGTVSIDSETYVRLLVSIGRSLAIDGFRRVLFVNGHGGNVNPGGVAIDRLSAGNPDVNFGMLSYWDCLTADMLAGFDVPVPGHAGGFEESLVSAIDPALIDGGERSDFTTLERPLPLVASDALRGVTRLVGMWEDSDGVTDAAENADAQFGARVLEQLGTAIADYIVEFDVATRAQAPGVRVERRENA